MTHYIPNRADLAAEPRLRIDITQGNLSGLRGDIWSDNATAYAAVLDAGFEGIQGGDRKACRCAGLRTTGAERVLDPSSADTIVRNSVAAGDDALTLHIGTGFENEHSADRLVDAVLTASDRHDHPTFIETHRATITQDMWRTLELVKRHSSMRFNLDLSHWYCGQEMPYGELTQKIAALQPIFDRVGFLHGRIASAGVMQIAIEDLAVDGDAHITCLRSSCEPHVRLFSQVWDLCFRSFRQNAQRGELLIFAPELLPPPHYASTNRRQLPDGTFDEVEQSDRWEQAKLMAALVRRIWNSG